MLDWLGLQWNTNNGTISIIKRRIDKINNTIQNILLLRFTISARELASFVGQIISTGAVIGNIARIMTRHCSMSVASASNWDTKFTLDMFCRKEILFWKENISQLNQRDCFLEKAPSRFVYSDASDSGCGAIALLNGEKICHKMFTETDRYRSSTWRELTAIHYALRSFIDLLRATHVKWYTDNRAVTSIVEVGSMNPELQVLTINIFQLCLSNNITLDIQWVPREQNARADYISRLIDPDDWQITEEFFQILETLWGPHSVDCFANYYNYKIPQFFSRFWNPNTSGVDFFVQTLSNENCLAVPPISIISRAIQYLRMQEAQVTLVVPYWPSANYWPIVMSKYIQFVQDYRLFEGQQVLRHGRNKNSLLGSKRFIGQVMAVRLDFSLPGKGIEEARATSS